MRKHIVPGLFAFLAIFVGASAAKAFGDLVEHPTAHTVLVLVYFLLRTGVGVAFVVATVRRRAPLKPARKPAAFIACAVAIVLVVPITSPTSASSALVIAGDATASLAATWLLVSVMFLGRCFSVLPEARGLVVRGPYRFVRHPVYLGEIVMFAGLTLAGLNSSRAAVSAVVVVLFVLAQSARMRMEEQALTDAFPAYRLYAAQTGRLLPRMRRRREMPRTLDLGLAAPSASSVVAGNPGR
jgi:protein-S-isoprenylcysteine O-methyltransferase Ste14